MLPDNWSWAISLLLIPGLDCSFPLPGIFHIHKVIADCNTLSLYFRIMHPLTLFHYCPRCGSSRFTERNEKAKKCADCGFVYYFNPSSATVALILNSQGELLVTRRAKDPAKGTLDLPGGFVDMHETGEEGVAREVREETGFTVQKSTYLFSLPNIYPYSGFEVHTLDMFFLCEVDDTSTPEAHDDVAETFFIPLAQIEPQAFGLDSIRRGIERFIDMYHNGTLPLSNEKK